MTRKDKLATASKMLDGKATSPLDALTPDELSYLQARGFHHNGHVYSITTAVINNDETERKRTSQILEKLPVQTYIHVIFQ